MTPPDPAPAPEQAGVDGLTAGPTPVVAPAQAAVPPPPEQVQRAKKLVVAGLGGFYALYVLWCGVLLLMLPSPSGGLASLVSTGLLTSLAGGIIFVLAAVVAILRISRSGTSIALRQRSLMLAIIIVVPGLVLSAFVPFKITREPALTIDILQPTRAEDFVAPLPVTFSVERAVELLRKRGFRPVNYVWDTDGDGTANTETIVPTTTMLYERQGVYTAVVRIQLDGGDSRRVTRRITIPQAVFSVTPPIPIVERPVRFSVAHLLTDPKMVREVTWQFGDSTPLSTSENTDTVHTFYAIGEYQVMAVVQLQNNTQLSFQRTINVQNPEPLPFAVTMEAEPKTLIGPAPFGVIFSLQTAEPIKEIHWQFGDGKEEQGADLRRVGHSFDKPGIYPVVTRIRSGSGQLAELTTIIRVTESLSISDLRFEGTPTVTNGRVRGEVPLRVDLTPKTSLPLIEFSWDVPDALDALITGEKVEAVFRREGTYVLTLVAQNADGKVLRMPINVQVDPPAAEPVIMMLPESGEAPLTVQFDASQSFIPDSETLAGYKWTFGDEAGRGDDAVKLGTARVQHTYREAGEFVVKLQVVMASGKEFSTEKTILVRRPALSACLTTSRTRVQPGSGVAFDSSCTSGIPTSFVWDVRSESQPDVVLAQSPLEDYVHVFQDAGTYVVTLTVKDQFNNQNKKSVTITVAP